MENLRFGLELSVLGMGLVFTLLALLWGLLALLLRLDREPAPAAVVIEPPVDAAEPAEAPPAVRVMADGLHPDLLAAITIAVLTHSRVRRQQAAPVMRSYWPGSLIYASRWVAAGRSQQNRSWQRRG